MAGRSGRPSRSRVTTEQQVVSTQSASTSWAATFALASAALTEAPRQEVDKSQWIAIAMDQLLGPDTGRVFNDVSADIASGNTTPEKGVKTIEDSWKQNRAQ
jgi:hypothetical protein